ncbi:acidic mammalian chitinase-like [Topomyia yanbarensis]|uniref:acidic mammalian chitinase-like n=1 Tax=Topomyia yanbarensis TaxID=2498891 RepID=UPI00273C3E55|nr:acidic mammalian chitinase-like [Topomyia yanbarensis]
MIKLVFTFTLYMVLLNNVVLGGKNVVCYLGTWANYRPGDGKFAVSNIDPTLCTHYIYSFFGVNNDGTIAILDSWLDLPDGLNFIAQFNNLKQANPALKTLAAIGGWNLGSAKFSTVAKDATLRSTFATQARIFCQKYGFDGIDIDWEYPAQRDGDRSVDKANFVLMLNDLEQEFSNYGLLLTVAVAAAANSAAISYDIPGISAVVDYINLMEYDFHGSYDGITGENAPLYAGPADITATQQQLNVDSSVKYWLNQGAPASKLNLGMPLYGRTYTLSDVNQNGIGAPVSGAGTAGPYTQEAGFMGYNEICENQLTGAWTDVWYNVQMVPYAYNGNQWVGYDNARSILAKCNLIKTYGLAGGMFWSIDTDDFLGKCGTKFELTTALKNCLASSNNPTTTTAKTTTLSSTTQVPVTSTTSTAAVVTTTTSGTFVCQATGYFRDPVNCNKYYYCSGTYRYDFNCPGGLFFNTQYNYCDYPYNVPCP